MKDQHIISLFWERNEDAITQLQEKYGRLCVSIARHILPDDRDAEECMNDAMLRVWNAIPPEKPNSLSAYLCRIVRNLALERYSYNTAAKRNSSLTTAFEELEEILPTAQNNTELFLDEQYFHDFINSFLRSQPKDARILFIRRYWYGESIREIALNCHFSEEKIKSSLFRTRNRLRLALLKEGIEV